jgi:hypothetical protein
MTGCVLWCGAGICLLLHAWPVPTAAVDLAAASSDAVVRRLMHGIWLPQQRLHALMQAQVSARPVAVGCCCVCLLLDGQR